MKSSQHKITNAGLIEAEGVEIAKIIKDYARAWTLLLGYDEQTLEEPENRSDNPKKLDKGEALQAVSKLKKELIKQGEATDLFGCLTGNGLSSALGTIEQTFDGRPL